MARRDVLKRYLEAGLDFTSVTQGRAEALVRDLVKAGEVQADQTREVVADLIERSRKNSEHLLRTVRKEVRAQITSLGLASQDDLDRLEERISKMLGVAKAPSAKKASTKTSGARKPAKKKPAAKRKPAAKKKTALKSKAAPKKAPPEVVASEVVASEVVASEPVVAERVAEQTATEASAADGV
jgi:polyhydroxyalkanoate synthesis regulator phasin